jgi:hypothetical protein
MEAAMRGRELHRTGGEVKTARVWRKSWRAVGRVTDLQTRYYLAGQPGAHRRSSIGPRLDMCMPSVPTAISCSGCCGTARGASHSSSHMDIVVVKHRNFQPWNGRLRRLERSGSTCKPLRSDHARNLSSRSTLVYRSRPTPEREGTT